MYWVTGTAVAGNDSAVFVIVIVICKDVKKGCYYKFDVDALVVVGR